MQNGGLHFTHVAEYLAWMKTRLATNRSGAASIYEFLRRRDSSELLAYNQPAKCRDCSCPKLKKKNLRICLQGCFVVSFLPAGEDVLRAVVSKLGSC